MTQQQPKEPQVYGKRLRLAANLIGLALMFGPVLGAVALMRMYAPGGHGPIAAALCVGSISVGIVSAIAYCREGPFLLNRWLAPTLRGKISRCYGADVSNTLLVGIAPGEEMRSYNGDTSWDIGFLRLEAGRMVYLGDISSYELRPDQVTSTRIEEWKLGLGIPSPRMILAWAETPASDCHHIILEPSGARSRNDARRFVQDLGDRIEAWRQSGSSYSSPAAYGLPPLEDAVPSSPLPGSPKPGPATPGSTRAFWLGTLVGLLAAATAVLILMFLAFGLLGHHTARRPVVRYGIVAIALLVSRVVATVLQRRIERDQGERSAQ